MSQRELQSKRMLWVECVNCVCLGVCVSHVVISINTTEKPVPLKSRLTQTECLRFVMKQSPYLGHTYYIKIKDLMH